MFSRAAIIVAAGSSQRFGQDKLMSLVQGRPLIIYSLEAFAGICSIEEVVLVVAQDRKDSFFQLLEEMLPLELRKKIKIVSGGKNRYESVRQGLQVLPSKIEWVAIHDGARPLISQPMIDLAFEKASEHGAAALAVPVTDTLHRASADLLAETTVNRENLWAMQTPQVFRKVDLMCLESQESQKGPTDEVSALLQHKKETYLVENREPNIKVTYPSDLKIVNALLSVSRKP